MSNKCNVQEEDDEENKCANCSCRLSPNQFCPKKSNNDRRNYKETVHEIPVTPLDLPLNSSKSGSSSSSDMINVKSALSSLYNLQYLNDLPILIFNEEEENVGPKNKRMKKEPNSDQDIGLCSRCGILLTNLYKFWDEFNSLREFDSYLSRSINKLDKILQQLQITWLEMTTMDHHDTSTNVGSVHDQFVKNDKTYCDRVSVTSSSSHNDHQPILKPLKDYQNKNLNLNQNSQLIDKFRSCQSEESTIKIEDVKPFPISTSTAAPDTFKGCVSNQGPWVKLCRLTNDQISNACRRDSNCVTTGLESQIKNEHGNKRMLCDDLKANFELSCTKYATEVDVSLQQFNQNNNNNNNDTLSLETDDESHDGNSNETEIIFYTKPQDKLVKKRGRPRKTLNEKPSLQFVQSSTCFNTPPEQVTTTCNSSSFTGSSSGYRYECTLCPKDKINLFLMRTELCQHFLSVHIDFGDFKTCPFSNCSYHKIESFPDLFQLTTHLTTVHISAKIF